MNKTKVYQPQYFKKFVCTGTKCVSNCCRHNWQIRIDKNTYNKYVKLGDAGAVILDKIKMVSEEPFIALITKDADGNCHFLDDNGLCSIQLTQGYDYLSRTCRIHPRSISYINGEFETFLELSCEEAVRVVLFEQEYMDFEEAILEPDGSGNVIPNRMLETEKYTSARNGVEIFHKLRSACVAIMQARQYKLRVRMMMLCLFIQQVSEQLAAGSDTNIPLFVKVFIDALSTNVYDSVAEELPDGIDLDFGLTVEILRDMGAKNDKRFNKYLKQAFDRFSFLASGDITPSAIAEYKALYISYFADKEYIFENFIVNHILMEGFPFNYNKQADIMSNYADLLAKYNLVEFLVTGVCASKKKFNKQSIIDCVSAFSRCYDHSLKGYLMVE
ncbi:MAG: flagellin lysine-N-methylase [Oscillospiraceae bacterium]|nr:flagellin lysine-N-methylase [Oscillospiraceae bacterium]